ncbi:MAG: hypothetical protein NVS4B3_06470 [Gemmatimonadaceae bacterium]
MRLGTLIGIILIVLGILGFAYQGITYTQHKDVVRIGPIEATAEQRQTVPISPLVSGLAVVAGVALVVAVRRAR